jgi:hypothetical protein
MSSDHFCTTHTPQTSSESTIANFADDPTVKATDNDTAIASHKLQTSYLKINAGLETVEWKPRAIVDPVTFTARRETCPAALVNNAQLPQAEDVNFLGLYSDRRPTWHKHIFAKRKQLSITLVNMYWLLGRKSYLTTSNTLLIYKAIFKLIWTYGIELWGSASTSNIEILDRFQSKALHMITDSPWYEYVPNKVIRQDLQIPSVKE